MSQITVNTINGQPPYTIYVCDYSQVTCTFVASGITSIPYTFTIPAKFSGFTTVGIQTIDANNCQSFTLVSCITQTPTPSITATPTITNSNTPTNTPTPSVTQTTITPTPTPSFTQTPTLTPTPSPTNILILPLYRNLNCAICLIEKSSDSENIGTYMDNLGMSFYGFTNGTVPDSNQSIFQAEMNVYMDYFYSAYTSGLTISLVPTNQNGPISGPVFKTQMIQGEDPNSVSAKTTVDKYDSFGNLYRLNNFETVEITGITKAWHTWVIPTGLTLNKFQKYIDLGIEDPNSFQLYEMNESLYSNYFTYTGTNFVKTVYRVYTTYPSLDFYLDSTISKIYFKGNSLSE